MVAGTNLETFASSSNRKFREASDFAPQFIPAKVPCSGDNRVARKAHGKCRADGQHAETADPLGDLKTPEKRFRFSQAA